LEERSNRSSLVPTLKKMIFGKKKVATFFFTESIKLILFIVRFWEVQKKV
jgi:hypothetical protein